MDEINLIRFHIHETTMASGDPAWYATATAAGRRVSKSNVHLMLSGLEMLIATVEQYLAFGCVICNTPPDFIDFDDGHNLFEDYDGLPIFCSEGCQKEAALYADADR